jgi:hypothetical protein
VAKAKNFLDLVIKYNQFLAAQSAAATKPGPAGSTPAQPVAPKAAPPPAAAPTTPVASPPPAQVQVTVPEFNAEQLEDDTIRGFNGWAGDDGFSSPKVLHEFRIVVDKKTGNLVVDSDPKSGTAKAQWERVPVADRPSSGDPDYINSVKNRDPKTCAKIK